MKRSAILLFLLAGCGASTAISTVEQPIVAWGLFDGLPPVVVAQEGGAYHVVDFTRQSEGVYEVVYNVSTVDAGTIIPLVSGLGLEVESGLTALSIVGASQLFDRTDLTIQVVTLTNLVDGIFLLEFDAVFSLALLGEP